tara:strand:+ start:3604 stop:4035 length:432 start_codon:yes stop_codon:yes gene_type:complete
MGLDCYIVHGNDRDKAFTHGDDDRIKNVNLCGGLMSGNGDDGSFRGKFYEQLVSELMQHPGGIWHLDEDEHVSAVELKEQADALGHLITLRLEDADEEDRVLEDDTIIYQDSWNSEFTFKEICDLETLFRVASERGAVMKVWW